RQSLPSATDSAACSAYHDTPPRRRTLLTLELLGAQRMELGRLLGIRRHLVCVGGDGAAVHLHFLGPGVLAGALRRPGDALLVRLGHRAMLRRFLLIDGSLLLITLRERQVVGRRL